MTVLKSTFSALDVCLCNVPLPYIIHSLLCYIRIMDLMSFCNCSTIFSTILLEPRDYRQWLKVDSDNVSDGCGDV